MQYNVGRKDETGKNTAKEEGKLNLPKFLKEVDRISGMMAKEEIAAFVHDIARTLPETMRRLSWPKFLWG